MYSPTVIGVDPGLVHTGIVMLDFNLERPELTVAHRVVDGANAAQSRADIEGLTEHKPYATLDIFIEHYVPRSGFSVDERMVQANETFRSTLGGTLLRNTGVKKVITQELMELLHCWKFTTFSNHQDLRSAARIALLGMMRDPALNQVLYTYCTDTTDGRTWNVRVI
jgi:hypothetical protein